MINEQDYTEEQGVNNAEVNESCTCEPTCECESCECSAESNCDCKDEKCDCKCSECDCEDCKCDECDCEDCKCKNCDCKEDCKCGCKDGKLCSCNKEQDENCTCKDNVNEENCTCEDCKCDEDGEKCECDATCKCDCEKESENCQTDDGKCGCGCDENLNQDNQSTETEDYFKRLLLLQAEFDNYRKRTNADLNNAFQNGFMEAITEFLPALDSFKMATDLIKDENTLMGIQYIEKGILSTLEKMGVKAIDATGKFDPKLHQAIGTDASPEYQEGDIVKECFKGFTYGDKVIRYSQVIVKR